MTLYSPQPPKRQPPKALRVLFDLDNGNPKSRNYLFMLRLGAEIPAQYKRARPGR